LIAAFAEQLTTVPPDIIDEVADDLRLSVTSALLAERSKSNGEALQAHEDTALILQPTQRHVPVLLATLVRPRNGQNLPVRSIADVPAVYYNF